MSIQVIEAENERFVNINKAIASYLNDRKSQLELHDGRIKDLEQERLESVNWNEKNDLAEKLKELSKFDPRKYLLPFTSLDSPYFGVVGINDTAKAIGLKEYVLGKQSLINGTKVHIVDWRKAEVSRFFYEYEEGEDYEEEINNCDRIGLITHKRQITINKGQLTAIQTAKNNYKLINDTWTANTGEKINTPVSADIKNETGNHHLIDIVALIKPDQFSTITKKHEGCVYLTGGAGAGKTTVAEHRLSYLQFNYPELFRPERCLFIVFNKTLQQYVSNTSKTLIGDTAIETYSAWAITALSRLGCTSFKPVVTHNKYDYIKKNSNISQLLDSWVKSNPKTKLSPIQELFAFYTSAPVQTFFFGNVNSTNDDYIHYMELYQPFTQSEKIEISFADLGPLLRLCQLRTKEEVIDKAFNYYDHIIADEAQDFSQIELETIYNSLNERKSITLCADPKQKILSFVDGTGLENFKSKLQQIGLDRTTFTIGYRSAPEIMHIANVVAQRTKGELPKKNTATVKIIEADNRQKAITELIETVKSYQRQDPSSLTAIICKTKADFNELYGALSASTSNISNLHAAGQIIFTPGVIITNAHQVKGLEFTNVVIWNPSAKLYRKNDDDKNLLYVAISRACKRLSLIHFDPLSSWFKNT